VRGAPPYGIDCDIMRESQKERASIANALESSGSLSQSHEHFLDSIARLGLAASEVQEESVKRRRMLIIEPGEIKWHRDFHKDAPTRHFCLCR
jgi:hypothetical protein